MRMLLVYLLPLAVVTLVLDRVTKVWIVDGLDLKSVLSIDVLPPFLNLRMAWNTGINFGIGGGGPEETRWILVGLSIAISLGLTVWVLRRKSVALALGAGAVVGGAIGNAWDRVTWGAVADFLNMSCCGIQNPFSFNVADIAIFAGAVWIALRA